MFQLFQLATLVRFCIQITNSVVVAGLFYGFLTAGTIGPSYLLLLRARVLEKGSEKDVSATTGFLMGQLIMFISIYYAPLHLALGTPHRITFLRVLYLWVYFFWRNGKDFFDSVPTTRNGMRNLYTQYVFLTNIIFPLFNHFVLPSSTLPRVISIYMFRCNNKMLFLTSSFVGWFIGHILCMKGFELVLFWIRQNRSIRLNRYRAADFRNSLERIFTILLFLCCFYYSGRIPSLIRIEDIIKKKEKKNAETAQSADETDVEKDTTYKQGQEGSAEADLSPFSEDSNNLDEKPKEKKDFFSEMPLVTFLFDYNRWNRPLRYIKTDGFQKALRTEMSDYFFDTGQSDGKQRISFTYPPSLSTFFEMIERKGFLDTPEKLPSDELDNHWIYTNEQKRNSLSNELFHRIDALERGSLDLDVLEKRTRLCNDETAQECLPKRYDSFLNGPFRGTIPQLPPSVKKENEKEKKNEKENEKEKKNEKKNEKENEKEKKNEKENAKENDSLITPPGDSNETVWINKFHGSLFPDYQEFEQKRDTFEAQSVFSDEGKMDSENQVQYFFGTSTTEPKEQTIQKNTKEGLDLEEIGKTVPRWTYQLLDESEEMDLAEADPESSQIISRIFKTVFVFDWKDYHTKRGKAEEYDPEDEDTEEILIRYSNQSDLHRDLIEGSVRAQRRKAGSWKLFFQTNLHSPLFVDRIDTIFSPILKIMDPIFRNPIFRIFRNWIGKGAEVKTWDYEEDESQEGEDKAQEREDGALERDHTAQTEAEKRENAEEERLEIAELWDNIPYGHGIRGYLLLAHSILRKYIVLPALIIAKNFSLFFLFPFEFPQKFPEWYKGWDEDWKAWGREMHVNCTHNGVTISETEFPKNWFTDGMQIKILFPFRLRYSFQLQPHHKGKDPMSKKRKKAKSCFLTIWGMETERPFGAHRDEPHPLEPIYKEFEKKMREAKKKSFQLLKNKAKWILDPFIKIKQLAKGKLNKKFAVREGYELSETQNDPNLRLRNQILDESSSRIQSMDWTKSALTEQKIKDLSDRTSTIRNQIEKITNDKKTKFLIPDRNMSPSEASFAEKRFDSSKNLWQIVKRRNVRLLRKGRVFLVFFMESIFSQILIRISNHIVEICLELLQLKKRILDTYSYFKQKNHEGIDENPIHWILTLRKKFSNSNIGNPNSKTFSEIVSLSQAYVFYKLSQRPGIHKYPLKFVLQYSRTSLFLKERIKNFFGTQGIFHFESRHKEHGNAELTEWKNWLSGHYQYQYDFSQTRLSQFMSQKWRNRINQSRKVQNLDAPSLDSYEKNEKNQVILFEKQKETAASLSVKKKRKKFKKHYKYDLLSQKYLNYGERKDFSIYRLPLQGNEGQGIPSKYITYKPDFFSIRRYSRKNAHRKYLDWKIICFRKTRHIETWINKKTKIATHYSPIITTINKKDLFYYAIHKQFNSSQNKKNSLNKNKKNSLNKNKKNSLNKNKKNSLNKNKKNSLNKNKKNSLNKNKKHPFDWMGMNKARLTQTQCSKKSIYQKYRMRPWIIPSKLLLFEVNNNINLRDSREKINTKEKEKEKEKEKKDLELENQNQEEKRPTRQENPRLNQPNQGKPESNQPNQQQDVKQESSASDIEKEKKKKKQEKKKWKPSTDLDIFLKKKSVDFKLTWTNLFEENFLTVINISSFLLRMRDPRELAISFFRRKEMPLSILKYPKTKLTLESESELTLESESELTLESESELTLESESELTLESEPELTLESEPELTLESEPELTLESEPELTLESELKTTLESKLKPTLESELKPTLESEPPIPFPNALKSGEILFKLVCIPRKWDGPLIMYQTIAISLISKNKQPITINRKMNRKCQEKQNVDRNDFSEFITKKKHEKMVGNIDENRYDLLVPENISSPRRRRELRILICFNSGKGNPDVVGKKKVFCNENNVSNCSLTNSKHLDIEPTPFMKLKLFLWPNYRFEDLACMNRYWFDTCNGSRFSMVRIKMYPRLRIR